MSSAVLDRYLRDVHARGIRVAEHPDYGGVNNALHMPGSEHGKGNAADLNFGPPGAPPEEKPALLWASRLADAAGLNVIYAYHREHPIARTNANHRGHLHVDAGRITVYRPPGRDDALYARILAERPVTGSGSRRRKPHRIGTVSRSRRLLPRTKWRERLVQRRLAGFGSYTGKIDGSFGPRSEAAVKEFQRKRGLKADGVVGPNTWYEMARGTSPGESGVFVEIAQRVMGFTGKQVDGKHGPGTQVRAQQVQRWLDVKDDGSWGDATIAALKRKG